MAKKDKPEVPIVDWYPIQTGTVDQPEYMDCPCPKDPAITKVMLTTCGGCKYNAGLGLFSAYKCRHPNAGDVVRAWAKRIEAEKEAEARRQAPQALVAPVQQVATPSPAPAPSPVGQQPAAATDPAQLSLF